ncbi:MAG: hypothetical protein ACRDO8_05635, partial [Nocardioidaceae bacterium]
MPAPPSRARRRTRWRLAVPLAAGAAGLLMVTSALSANGTDLRSDTTDLSTLVHERTDRVADMRGRVQTM